MVTLLVVEVRKMSKKQQGYNKATSGASIQSTNASYGTEFATETNAQAVKQANAQSEAKKAQLLVHKVQTLVMVQNLQLKQMCML